MDNARTRILVGISVTVTLCFIGTKLFGEEYGFQRVPEPITITANGRSNQSLDIAIVIVLANASDANRYRTALNSVEHYSDLHGYRLHLESELKYEECSKHHDIMFLRHCHTHQMMVNELPEDSWVLFIGADVGVVNPNKLIEDFVEPEYDIYLYSRVHNWEFSAQYLVKNNQRGRDWVKQWADMELTLPKSFHGSDNGALHILMMHYLAPDSQNSVSIVGRLCHAIWERSANANDLSAMEACTRLVIGERTNFEKQHTKIFPSGKGWARDIRLLKSRWSTNDFMLYSIKEDWLKPDEVLEQEDYNLLMPTDDTLKSPIAFPVLNITKTESGDYLWIVDGSLRITNTLHRNLLHRMVVTKWQEQYQQFSEYVTSFKY